MISFKKKRKAHLQLGRLGENDACALLKAKGLEILSRNWKTALGELDIVGRDGGTIVFIEVKTLRQSESWRMRNISEHIMRFFSAKRRNPPSLPSRFRPAVNFKVRQARRNLRAARRYLRIIGHPVVNIRFDFIEVVRGRFTLRSIRHYKNFLPGGYR